MPIAKALMHFHQMKTRTVLFMELAGEWFGEEICENVFGGDLILNFPR